MKKNKLSHPPERGHKVGTKRADKRWVDGNGALWASRYESLVYESARRAGCEVRKCDKGGDDTFSYHSKVRDGVCQSCKGADVIQQRRYTPDLRVIRDPREGGEARPYHVECKGYMRAAQRSLLRDLLKTGTLTGLRFILQANYKATGKLTVGAWIDKYLHVPWTVFTGEWPTQWNYEPKKGKSPKTGAKRVLKDGLQREGS